MTDIRGFEAIEGTYVVMEDVISTIQEYAQSLPEAHDGAVVHALAVWMAGGEEPVSYEVHGAEPDDVTPDVARVEVYPDPPDDPRPKWYARSVDTGGFVMKTTGGSFDQEWVIKNAQERWPEVTIHLLKNAGEDSKWTEDGTRGVFPSLGPPARRVWAGVPG